MAGMSNSVSMSVPTPGMLHLGRRPVPAPRLPPSPPSPHRTVGQFAQRHEKSGPVSGHDQECHVSVDCEQDLYHVLNPFCITQQEAYLFDEALTAYQQEQEQQQQQQQLQRPTDAESDFCTAWPQEFSSPLSTRPRAWSSSLSLVSSQPSPPSLAKLAPSMWPAAWPEPHLRNVQSPPQTMADQAYSLSPLAAPRESQRHSSISTGRAASGSMWPQSSYAPAAYALDTVPGFWGDNPSPPERFYYEPLLQQPNKNSGSHFLSLPAHQNNQDSAGTTGTTTNTTNTTTSTTSTTSATSKEQAPAPASSRTFKPMQMVHRERWAARRERQQMLSLTPSPSPPDCLPSAAAGAAGAAAAAAGLLPPEEQLRRRLQGISLNYRGDIDNPHNRSDHVPDHLNTSLFLTNLPATATVGDLLRAVAALGPTGRVFAASVTAPDPTRGHRRAAAKISFFTRPQAERLKALIDQGDLVMAESVQQQTPTLATETVRAIWNRDKKAPRRCIQAHECRVLHIRGPAAVVSYEALTAYFSEKFYYELEEVKVLERPTPGEQLMEWRFASFQSQAIAAKMALNHEKKMVLVEYGRDPCE